MNNTDNQIESPRVFVSLRDGENDRAVIDPDRVSTASYFIMPGTEDANIELWDENQTALGLVILGKAMIEAIACQYRQTYLQLSESNTLNWLAQQGQMPPYNHTVEKEAGSYFIMPATSHERYAIENIVTFEYDPSRNHGYRYRLAIQVTQGSPINKKFRYPIACNLPEELAAPLDPINWEEWLHSDPQVQVEELVSSEVNV